MIGLLAGLWVTRRVPRTDLARAALILWGGWLAGTWLVLGYMSSSFHTYYTIEPTPALAALGAVGGTLLWRRREHRAARASLAAMSAATGWWVFHLLDATPAWLPWLRWSAPRLDAMLSDAENRWAAASVGSQQVSAIELRTGASLLAIGGFSGRNDSPTLARFERYVAAGDVHYFLMSARPQSRGTGRTTASDADEAHTARVHRDATATRPDSPSAASNSSTSGGRITAWVQAHYTPITVDRMRVYDLTVPPCG